MDNKDFLYISHLLTNEEKSISERLYAMEKRYIIFGSFDTLDLFELIELKQQLAYLRNLEQKLLKLCYDLQRFDDNL